MKFYTFFISFMTYYYIAICSSQYVERFRGVPLIKKPLYDPSDKTHFQCLDGSDKIPFDWVNNDYCDCMDGSDEPGTSACSKGKFHCINLGHRAIDIPASRVNDMICDCCDGSDEWSGQTTCANYCDEEGRAARERAVRLLAINNEGFKKKSELVQQGKDTKSQNNKKLDEIRAEREAISKQLEELDMVKQVAEKSENEAKDSHLQRWKAEVELRDKEKQKEKATAVFEDLDVNKDKKVSYEEMTGKFEFDKDQDGQISDEEIKEYLGDQKEMALEHFVNEMWQKLKDIYKQPVDIAAQSQSIEQQQQQQAATGSSLPPPSPSFKPNINRKKRVSKMIEEARSMSDDDGDDDDDEKDDAEPEVEVKEDEVEDFETHEPSLTPSTSAVHPDDVKPPGGGPEGNMPDYDENTKKLIADADQARKEYDDIKHKLQGLDDEMRRIEEFVKVDFGAEEEFAHLYRRCFEYSDVEYTYGLCLFDRTYQKPKGSSHGEVNLGSWDAWIISENSRYSKQMYKNGQGCWNGPSRSTEVTFKCGVENRLVSATEPARCEYAMEFETPAVCTEASAASQFDEHLEL